MIYAHLCSNPPLSSFLAIFSFTRAPISNYFRIFAYRLPLPQPAPARRRHIWKASLMLCFWPSETSTLQKTSQEQMQIWMLRVLRFAALSVCRGHPSPSRTHIGWLHICNKRGYSNSVRSLEKASDGLNGERQTWGYPAFFYVPSTHCLILLTLGYQSELLQMTNALRFG